MSDYIIDYSRRRSGTRIGAYRIAYCPLCGSKGLHVPAREVNGKQLPEEYLHSTEVHQIGRFEERKPRGKCVIVGDCENCENTGLEVFGDDVRPCTVPGCLAGARRAGI